MAITNTADSRPETTWINEKTEHVWVARKRVKKAGAAQTLQWTDSRACYQLVETLATLADLDQAAGAPTSVDDKQGGMVYRVEGAGLSKAKPASKIRLTSGAEVPARAVVQGVLDGWAACWSDTPPTLGANQ